MAYSAQLELDLFGDLGQSDDAERAIVEAAYEELVERRLVALDEAKRHGIYRLYASCPENRVQVHICPACGTWEANDWLVGNNHGIAAHFLDRRDDGSWGTCRYGADWCLALDLTSSHVAGDHSLSTRQIRMLDGLRPEIRTRFDRIVAETRELIAARSVRGA